MTTQTKVKTNIDIDTKLDVDFFVYTGTRKLRHESEPTKADILTVEKPDAYPHTFVNFRGATFRDVMVAVGNDSTIVLHQKAVRELSTLQSVETKRERDNDIDNREHVLSNAYFDTSVLNKSETESSVRKSIENGEPIYVIDFLTAKDAIVIPLTSEQKLDLIKSNIKKAFWEPAFVGLSTEEQYQLVEDTWEDFKRLLSS